MSYSTNYLVQLLIYSGKLILSELIDVKELASLCEDKIFPSGKVEVFTLTSSDWDSDPSSSEVLKIMDAAGKQPANIIESLTWWARLPCDKKDQTTGVVILNSDIHNKRVLSLSGRFNNWHLSFRCIPSKWGMTAHRENHESEGYDVADSKEFLVIDKSATRR